ncbi:MAG: hypothetical protein KJ072_03660 [Verrucomicrobia bacterium]|nr:hypothetical protein [Verrucomicrobiota bacterium]
MLDGANIHTWFDTEGDDGPPPAEWLAVGASNHAVEVWDVKSRRRRHILTGHAWHCLSLDFSADAKTRVTSGIDYTVRLWNLATGRETQVLENVDRLDICSVHVPAGLDTGILRTRMPNSRPRW